MQMTFGMKELASAMFAVIIFVIGIVLSFTTLLLSVTTVVDANTKTMAMMRVFGYSRRTAGRRSLMDTGLWLMEDLLLEPCISMY